MTSLGRSLLWIAVVCAGWGGCGSKDSGGPDSGWDIAVEPDDAGDLLGDVAGDELVADSDAGDVTSDHWTSLEPVYERGLVVPENSISCFNYETNQEQNNCNNHGSSVAVTADGTVLAVWYQGVGEYSLDSRILWSRKAPGMDWSPWETLFDEERIPEGNPVIWVHEDGTLYLFFMTVEGESWNDGVIRLMTSADQGETWTEPVMIREEWNWMTRNHPVRLSSGELLLPCYDESLYEPSFLTSPDDFAAVWLETGDLSDADYFMKHLASIQPSVIERSDGSVLAITRNTGVDDFPYAWEMTSVDGGRTWSENVQSAIPNNNTAIEMTKLASGRVMMVFNNTFDGRYPLSVALSEDEGRTWPYVVDLDGPCDGSGCSHGYTSLSQDPTDGSVWITYTHNRTSIGWVHLNEAWVMAQPGSALVSPQVERSFVAVTFNTGTSGFAPDEDNDGYHSVQATWNDELYGNGLAWKAFVNKTREWFAEVDPDVAVFQEIFYSGECPAIPSEAWVGFVCEDWVLGDPTVVQLLLPEGYQIACNPGKPDKCAAVHRRFGSFRGCDSDFCLEGLDGGVVEGCGKGSRVGRGVIDLVAGGTLTLVNVHGSSGFTDEDALCRRQQFDQVFVDLGDGQPAANGEWNLVMGDLNTDPGRLAEDDVSAARWLDFVGDGKPFYFLSDVGPDALPTYAGFVNIDHVVTDVLQGACWSAGVTPGHEAVMDSVFFDHHPQVCELHW